MNFDYIQLVKIIFGNYRIHELKNLIQQFEGDGLLICDRCFVEKEIMKPIIDLPQIKECFYDVSANPDTSEVDDCCQIVRKKH